MKMSREMRVVTIRAMNRVHAIILKIQYEHYCAIKICDF